MQRKGPEISQRRGKLEVSDGGNKRDEPLSYPSIAVAIVTVGAREAENYREDSEHLPDWDPESLIDLVCAVCFSLSRGDFQQVSVRHPERPDLRFETQEILHTCPITVHRFTQKLFLIQTADIPLNKVLVMELWAAVQATSDSWRGWIFSGSQRKTRH